ncbi:MAG TPA: hypothetical protein VIW73_07930, partial [Candidatus Cybelea sp.]
MSDASVNDDLGYPIVVAEDTRSDVAAFARKAERQTIVLCDANRAVAATARGIATAARAGAPHAFVLGERSPLHPPWRYRRRAESHRRGSAGSSAAAPDHPRRS